MPRDKYAAAPTRMETPAAREGTSMDERILSFKIWVKTIPPVMLGVAVVTLVVINMNAVIEPKVNLVFAQYERLDLMPVLVVTTLAGVAIGLLIRTVFETLRRFRHGSVVLPPPLTTRSRIGSRARGKVGIQHLPNNHAARAIKDDDGHTQV